MDVDEKGICQLGAKCFDDTQQQRNWAVMVIQEIGVSSCHLV